MLILKQWYRGLTWRRGLRKLGTLSLLFFLVLGLSNIWVISSVQGAMFEDLADLPERQVALVLGTSRSVDGRHENPFFSNRIQATAALYHAGKVKHIIVSGDNSNKNYNEPRDMRKALVLLGVPDSCITMDFAGLRTLDSVVRCKEIFQQNQVIIVSQEFHNYRALFIARYHGLDALAYNADYPSTASDRMIWREYLARPKAIWDLYFAHTQPRHLGEKVDLPIHP